MTDLILWSLHILWFVRFTSYGLSLLCKFAFSVFIYIFYRANLRVILCAYGSVELYTAQREIVISEVTSKKPKGLLDKLSSCLFQISCKKYAFIAIYYYFCRINNEKFRKNDNVRSIYNLHDMVYNHDDYYTNDNP